ncbi:MAG: hypothetical protein IJR19_09560 [Lachnospiraceae bacterium]|nr:hypothetical protein [Lachnospiraceae bacterium]
MRGIIKLRKPVMIDGRAVNELSYDTDKITLDGYMKALNRAVVQGGGVTGVNIKIDSGAQTYIGMWAVLADNPRYDIMDLERVTGPDIMRFAEVGLLFISGREDPTPETSEEQSEAMPEPLTPTLEDSANDI